MRLPTSVILSRLMHEASADDVTFEWVLRHLAERSFGIVMLIVALVALVPGISGIAGLLLMVPAFQMILGRDEPVLSRWIGARRISRRRLVRLLRRVIPVFRRMERIVRPRWSTPFEATKRGIGIVMLLLSVTLLVPIPFSNIVPALAIVLLAFAFLEEDGLLLCIALFAATVSLAVTAAAVWGAVEAGLLL